MKKILVISWFFPPINSSEGLVTYKLLNSSKYEYDVFTQKNCKSWSYGNDDYLKMNKNINCVYSDATNLDDFKNSALNFFKENHKKYDIVMTRSMPEESHLVGLEIKKLFPNIKWIASFGDPIGSNPFTLMAITANNPYSLKNRYQRKMSSSEIFSIKRMIKNFLFNRRYKKNYKVLISKKNKIEKAIVDQADYVICNSNEQKSYIMNNNKIEENKFVVLPHSYSSYLYPNNKEKKNKKIIFSYIGHLDDIRTPRLLFESINDLQLDFPDLKDKVEMDFYGNMSDTDKLYIINNDLLDIIKIKKPVKYLESLKIMTESDWLIHIDANLSNIIDTNIFFAAKLADYLGAKKNIFAITMLSGASYNILNDNNALITSYSKNDIKNYLYLIVYENYTIEMDAKNRKKYNSENVAKSFDSLIEDIKEVK